MRKILVYGDVNLNIIDGSAIWLTSLAQVLLRAGAEVHILLKTPVYDNASLDKLRDNHACHIHEPIDGTAVLNSDVVLTPRDAAQRMLRLDQRIGFDAIFVRGMTICKFIAMSNKLHARSWLYVTDLPFPIERVNAKALADLQLIADRSYKLFAQTEESRSYLESLCPGASGKTLIMSPMVPDECFQKYDRRSDADSTSVQLVYAGKFAEDWKTLEALDLPRLSKESVRQAKLTMIGNKFQRSHIDPTWHVRMREAINAADIEWLGGLDRAETMFRIRDADLGIGWRSRNLDSSMEISTKALEYAALGVPPIVNRTQTHCDVFGSEYPFFVDDSTESVLRVVGTDAQVIESYRDKVREAVRGYSMSSVVNRMRSYFERFLPVSKSCDKVANPIRVLIAGHDLKFAGELIEYFKALDDVSLTIDKWSSLHNHDVTESRRLLSDADVVICEWAGPNAVWYSNNLLPHQRLLIRLHAFELRGPWLKNIDINSVTNVVCVSQLYVDKAIEATGWNRAVFRVIPNLIDVLDLGRPKLEGSEFRLGLVGMVPFIKRPDRAVALLRELRKYDKRYSLHIRGRMPWEYPYEWNKGLQRFAYEEFFEELRRHDDLRDSVVFDDFGSDMASWLRRIGVVLSPSTRESFHLAPIEGMAGGAVPIVWDRPGAVEIFSDVYVYQDMPAMVDQILKLRDDTVFRLEQLRAKEFSHQYDLMAGTSAWLKLIAR